MKSKLDEQLEELNQQLIRMGGLIEEAILNAVEAFEKQDKQLAHRAIEFDKEVDYKEKEIESLCLKLLLRQQPVARDLRMISAALKMITDMERIGDQAADISELTILLCDSPYLMDVTHIKDMAKKTISMVTESVDAYVNQDIMLAEQVIKEDDLVDNLFLLVKKELIALIQKNAEGGEQATDFLMVAKYLERIGDHATNIAEWVIFSITGRHKEEKEPE